jgi:hypothetical protein
MSERDIGQVGRATGTTVERRDAGALVLWFVAVAIVDDVAAVAACKCWGCDDRDTGCK